MADYIKRKTADGTKFSNGDWEAFARDVSVNQVLVTDPQLPERPASSYLQHYMAYQERIDGYVLDFEGGRTVPPEASIPPSSTQITKRSSVYSEAEERGMAQCIRQRLPMETRPCPKDWEVYALEVDLLGCNSAEIRVPRVVQLQLTLKSTVASRIESTDSSANLTARRPKFTARCWVTTGPKRGSSETHRKERTR